MREVLVIRHAQSFSNLEQSTDFGMDCAELTDTGKMRANQLGLELQDSYGIVIPDTKVAVSEFQRTDETADTAGFRYSNRTQYPSLNEVGDPNRIKDSPDRLLPSTAIEAAKHLIANPPKENIWISHGMVIAGLREVLGMEIARPDKGKIPSFCQISELLLPH